MEHSIIVDHDDRIIPYLIVNGIMHELLITDFMFPDIITLDRLTRSRSNIIRWMNYLLPSILESIIILLICCSNGC